MGRGEGTGWSQGQGEEVGVQGGLGKGITLSDLGVKYYCAGNSLAVQGLGHGAFTAGLGSFPGRGTTWPKKKFTLSSGVFTDEAMCYLRCRRGAWWVCGGKTHHRVAEYGRCM